MVPRHRRGWRFHLGESNAMSKITYNVSSEDVGKRLDVFLVEKTGSSRSEIQKLIGVGSVLINQRRPKKAGEELKENYAVAVLSSEDVEHSRDTEDVDKSIYKKIQIVADEPDYLVVAKPAGLLSHPTPAGEPASLAGWILEQYPALRGVGEDAHRPGIVHRLDKDASGLMVIAKSQAMFDHLKQQFKHREIEKEYIVLVYGTFSKDHDVIDFDIDRGKDGRMVARPKLDQFKVSNVGKEQEGKIAKTEYRVRDVYKGRFSLLRVKIYTGRTHQIRVHMFAIHHPVVGDRLYIDKKLLKKGDEPLDRLFLHSAKLGFTDLSGFFRVHTLNLSDDLKEYLARITI